MQSYEGSLAASTGGIPANGHRGNGIGNHGAVTTSAPLEQGVYAHTAPHVGHLNAQSGVHGAGMGMLACDGSLVGTPNGSYAGVTPNGSYAGMTPMTPHHASMSGELGLAPPGGDEWLRDFAAGAYENVTGNGNGSGSGHGNGNGRM